MRNPDTTRVTKCNNGPDKNSWLPFEPGSDIKTLKPHSHLCLIYETPEEWQQTVIPFLKQGLTEDKKCLFLVNSVCYPSLIEPYLQKEGIDIKAVKTSRQLIFLDESKYYEGDNSFDNGRLVEALIAEVSKAESEGFSGTHLVREIDWKQHNCQSSDSIMEFEAICHQSLFPFYACNIICSCNRWMLDPSILKIMITSHPYIARGNSIYHNIYYTPPELIFTSNPQESQIQFILNNLEKRSKDREREEALRESQRALTTLLSNLPGMAYRCTNEKKFTIEWVSEGCYDLTGYTPAELENYKTSYAQLIKEEDRERVWITIQKALKESRPFQIEYRIITKDGKEKWVWEQGREVATRKGERLALEGFITDITERKQAEEQLKTSLKEKEMLLKEIHHRVKNNLQIITSLLNLQSRYIKDEQTLEMFKESQNRIKTMALIHEKLYKSKDIARINFAEYINNLASHLFHSYGISSKTISLKVNVDNILLDVDTAIPCGLIINELVSNSLKYAFPGGKQGEIRVDFRAEKNNNFVLIVADTGIGLSEEVDFRRTETLGLQLVCILTEQLGGNIELNREKGTEFKITFPV